MKKVIILGCENSHAWVMLNLLKKEKQFSDVEVVGVYSDEPDAMKKLHDEYGVKVLNTYRINPKTIDGVIITARHGDNHLKYALPYLSSGLPMFIDKPFAIKPSDAKKLVALAKKHKCKLVGGSILRFHSFINELKKDHENDVDGKTISGYVCAPIHSSSPYGGFYFYAQHLIEMITQIYGRYPLAINANKYKSNINVTFRYKDFSINGLYQESTNKYYALRNAEKAIKSRAIDISNEYSCTLNEFKEFYDILHNKKQALSYKDLASPTFIMDAIVKSIKLKKEVKVKYE